MDYEQIGMGLKAIGVVAATTGLVLGVSGHISERRVARKLKEEVKSFRDLKKQLRPRKIVTEIKE